MSGNPAKTLYKARWHCYGKPLMVTTGGLLETLIQPCKGFKMVALYRIDRYGHCKQVLKDQRGKKRENTTKAVKHARTFASCSMVDK